MKYNTVKNAKQIINNSNYLVSNPHELKGKWSNYFKNNNPICLELGSGRGSFIINMAKTYPNINFIGLELYASQLTNATEKLRSEKLNNLALINDDAIIISVNNTITMFIVLIYLFSLVFLEISIMLILIIDITNN